MNILVVTSPRTAGTYFIKEYLPTQIIGKVTEEYSRGSVSRVSSTDGKLYFNYSEMFASKTQGLTDMQNLQLDLQATKFSHKTGEPIVTHVQPIYDQLTYIEQCHQYWEKLYHNSTDVHAVKIFRNHFRDLGRAGGSRSVNRLIKSSHKFYVLYRKDLSAVVYSLYYSWATGNYYHRETNNNEKIDVNPDIWKRLEQSILANYEFMLTFAKKNNVEVICTELDLPHLPYQTNHVFSDNSLVCDKSEYYHEEFQKLKL